jgi:hypothetical protein
MTTQIKDKKDIHGALTRVYCARYDNCLILIFDDGRWAHYMAYDDGDGDRHIELETDPPDLEELLHAGLLSNDEYLAQRAIENAARAQAQRTMELAALARLKAKYEATQ